MTDRASPIGSAPERAAARAVVRVPPRAVDVVVLLAPLALLLVGRFVPFDRLADPAAACLTLALPLAVGHAVTRLGDRIAGGRLFRSTREQLIVAGAIGAPLFLAGAFALAGARAFSAEAYGAIAVVLPIVALAALWLLGDRVGPTADDRSPDVERGWGVVWIVAVAFGVAVAVAYRWASPPPFQPTWDAFVHLRVIDGIRAGFLSPLTTDYSAAFHVNAYLPFHHLGVAVAGALTQRGALDVYWGGPFVVMPLYALLGALVGRQVGGGPIAAGIAAVAAVVVAFPFQSLSFLGLLPAATAALGFLAVLLPVLATDASAVRRMALVLVIAAGAATAHAPLGAAVLGLGIAGLAGTAILRRAPRLAVVLAALTVVVAIVGLLGYLNLVSLPEVAVGSYDPAQKEAVRIATLGARQRDFESRVALLTFVGLCAGALLLVREARRHPARAAIGGLVPVALVGMFLPVAGADRAFAVLPALAAPSLAWLIERATRTSVRPGTWMAERSIALGGVLAVALAIAILPSWRFVEHQQDEARQAGSLTSFGPAELAAATALRGGTPADSFLVSDPVSEGVFGGLGGRETFGGGPYASDNQLIALRDALGSSDAATMNASLWTVARDGGWAHGPVLIVVTGRTGAWLAEKDLEWVGYFRHLDQYVSGNPPVLRRLLRRLGDESWFQPVVRTGEVRVFALRPAAGAPVPGIDGPLDVPVDQPAARLTGRGPA